ncbi:amino acid permease [Neobacillus sp. PS3-12]|uniref:amino acid permease n=1 Tax=Neobacillus sp. PS3-12 TaxID=3070677 RepID=UPI0027E166DE|nr:amino acid permease [Neobacillus sp. PS3-12]WML54524.1 amino acid permease [Neobacillus sp. PS3-12]
MGYQNSELKHSLQTRHVTMISIGGVIGAGLFVGSGSMIVSSGPGALISYIIAGLLIVLIMRMLGEMAAVNPDSGSFSTYAHQAIGPWAGFTIGWLYWFNWVIIITFETTLLGQMLHNWVPSIPVWVGSVVFPIIMTFTNSFSVKAYGEFEYWLAFIKVAAIIIFLGLGAAIMMGIVPGVKAQGLSELMAGANFFPHGFTPVLLGVIFITFSLSGSEVAAIAAGESTDPGKNIIRAINSVVWRLMLFFVGSVTVLVMVIPQGAKKLLETPFASVFDLAGLPAAGQVMNIIIFISLLSVLNFGLYTSSRMLYSLATKGDAPKILSKVTKRGIPVWALVAGVIFTYVFTLFKFISPNTLFLFLANSSGGVTIIMYVFIAISHIKLRRKTEKENLGTLKVKMWLFPYLTYATILAVTIIYAAQAFISDMQSQFYMTSILTAAIIGAYFVFYRRKERVSVNLAEVKLTEINPE